MKHYTSTSQIFVGLFYSPIVLWIAYNMLEKHPQVFIMQIICLLAIVLAIALFFLTVKNVWLWYNDVPNPLTPEEWKRVNTIQALKEGTSNLSVGKRKKLAHQMVGKPLYEREVKDRIRIDQNGNFIRSLWLATKAMYWENRKKARNNAIKNSFLI